MISMDRSGERLLVRIVELGVYLFASATWGVWLLVRRRRLVCLARPEAPLIVAAVGSIAILAAGEIGEEARLIVSVLPFLAALPRAWGQAEVS